MKRSELQAKWKREQSPKRRKTEPSKRKSSSASLKQALVKEGFAPELKFFDTALSFAIDETGEIPATGQLALIPQGDTSTTRDGRQAIIKSIYIRGDAVYAPGASANATTYCKIYIIQDKQANKAAAAFADVFNNGTVVTRTMRELTNKKRFVILGSIDLQFDPGAGVTTAYNQQLKVFEWYKKVNIPMEWNAGTGAITEITQNNIFLMAGNVNADDAITVSGTCRLRFLG